MEIDYNPIVKAFQHLEKTLGERFIVDGSSMKEKLDSVEDSVPEELKKRIMSVALIRDWAIQGEVVPSDTNAFVKQCHDLADELHEVANRNIAEEEAAEAAEEAARLEAEVVAQAQLASTPLPPTEVVRVVCRPRAYMSPSQKLLHIGLGAALGVSLLSLIHLWPSTSNAPKARQGYEADEGSNAPKAHLTADVNLELAEKRAIENPKGVKNES